MKRFVILFALIATVALAGSISVTKPFSNRGVAWLLNDPTTGVDTITASQDGIGWADDRFTIQTPVGALQMYETGTPLEPVIYWPGRFTVDSLEADSITGSLSGNLISSGIIPSAVMNASMPPPFASWVDSATGAGANGLTYGNTGPLSANEATTPGNYFASIEVTDGGTETTNVLVGKVRTHSQMSVPRVVSVPANATATGTAGDIAYDASFLYVCTATNTWRRAALSTW